MGGIDRRVGLQVGTHELELGEALGAHPEGLAAGHGHDGGPALGQQRRQQRGPAQPVGGSDLGHGQEAGQRQRVVQLVRRPRLGPGLEAHLADRLRVEAADGRGLLRVQQVAGADRPRAALLGRRVVEERVGPRADDLLGQRRRRRELPREDLHLPAASVPEQRLEAVHVHEFVAGSRPGSGGRAGDRAPAGRPAMFSAQATWSGKTRASRSSESLRWNWGGTFRPLRIAADRERRGRDPAPARGKHGRLQRRLGEHVAHGLGAQVAPDFLQRKAVGGAQREHDAVLERRGLQLEVELPAEALAEREAPGPVQARAEGRMDDEVGVTHLVEEALEDQRAAGGQHAERGPGRRQVGGELLAGGGRQAERSPRARSRTAGSPSASRRSTSSRSRDTAAESSSVRPGDSPNQNGMFGGWPWASSTYTRPVSTFADPVGGVAQLEDVARDALEGEVLVERADGQALRQQHHVVVELVRDRAAVGDRR